MRRSTRAATIIGAVIALIVATVTPAVGAPIYTWLSCGELPPTTGSVTKFRSAHLDGTGTWRVRTTGILAPCRTPASNDVFAVAVYSTDGTAHGWAARYPTSSAGYLADALISPDTVAVCVIDSSNHRLDCVEIIWIPVEVGLRQPTTAGHIPVDSPMVSIEAQVDLNLRSEIDPSCATCV